MKKILKLAVLSAATVLTSCDNEDDNMEQQPMEFTVEQYFHVNVGGETKVLFNQASGNGEFKVKIKSDPEERKALHISSEGGVLSIDVDDHIALSDSVIIELSSAELDEVRLESDQVAEFVGVFDQEELTVVTEARSQLGLYDFKVDHLTCRTEGESEIELITNAELLSGDQTYEEASAVQIDDYTLLVDDAYMVVGDSITLENAVWTVYGEQVQSNFQMALCDFVTEGETNIYAEGAASRNININLEGESQARVWAFESIAGKGSGNSRLFYVNIPGLDLGNFITEGTAEVVPLE